MSNEEENTKTSLLLEIKAPLIAVVVALLVLVILLIPGFLTYPEDATAESNNFLNSKLIEVSEQQNQILRERIENLQSAIDQGMCAVDGQFYTNQGEVLPEAVQSALPPSPAALVAPCAGAEAQDVDSLKSLLESATVYIAIVVNGSMVGSGSGFFIDSRHVTTNAHVVDGVASGGEIYVFNTHLKPLKASVLAIGKSETQGGPDLAVLDIGEEVQVSPLIFANIEQTERVRAVGYPGHIIKKDLSFRQSMSNPSLIQFDKLPAIGSGDVVVKQEEQTGVWLYHDAYIDSGNSGGPLVDACGRVVGVNTVIQARQSGNSTILMPIPKAIALPTIKAFFAKNNFSSYQVSEEGVIPGSSG